MSNGNVSPDGKWNMLIEDNKVKWVQLTDQQPQVKIKEIDPELEKRMKGTWTVEEIIESMKRSYPEIWKK